MALPLFHVKSLRMVLEPSPNTMGVAGVQSRCFDDAEDKVS